MESLLDFAGGPLFRLTFALMVLGLLRIFVLDLWGMFEAYRKAGDKKFPWSQTIRRTIVWLLPVKKIPNSRPFYSIISILFHLGMIIVPIFLYAHVHLWKNSLGVGWITLPQKTADTLTLMVMALGLALLLGRFFDKNAAFISRKQDFLWPVLILIPFITGYVCSNVALPPKTYRYFMLAHVLSAESIFVLIPFTKIAHMVLLPFSQFVSQLAWRFPPETDEAVCSTLGKKGAPV